MNPHITNALVQAARVYVAWRVADSPRTNTTPEAFREFCTLLDARYALDLFERRDEVLR